jgi:amino acid adenylation domain-containing protein
MQEENRRRRRGSAVSPCAWNEQAQANGSWQEYRIDPTDDLIEFKIEEVEQSIPERFEKIVRQYPQRIAVKMGEVVVTYADLNAMANRLARMILTQQGDKAEAIALLFENGPAQMAAMLGILKTGNFFALLDPSFPRARLEAVLENSQAKLIITDRKNLSLAQELATHCRRPIEFETIGSEVSAENLQLSISPKAVAYIGYTSGSTGQPKGVVRDHRSFLHHIMLYTKAYHICEQDRLTLLASGTGRAVNDTFMALLNGGALLPFDVRGEGVTRLAGWLCEERISIWSVSSPLFRNVCKGFTKKEKFPDLRLIRLGGETAYKDDFDLYKTYFPRSCLLANGLTSHESGLLSTYLMGHETEIKGNELPVGYALEGKEVLLLDDAGKQVGFNEIGEIVVRSRYLSPGYWRNPELTAAKFKADPQGGEERLYFTGDLGVMFSDGCLIHKGRKDFRVKIRGYGVEIGEVEKALRTHACVKEVVVVARQNTLGEAYLVAYFTSSRQPSPSIGELRRFLNQKLPDYMAPSTFMLLDTIPLTPNGKLDRKALPVPDSSRPQLDVAYVAPRTSIERRLVGIWEEILDLRPIGIHDDFFDLGGHSLMGASLMAQVQRDFQVDLPLKLLFQCPTVAKLALCVEEIGGKPKPSYAYLVELQSGDPGRAPVFFFPGGGGSEPEFFLYARIARHTGLDYSFYGLRAPGTDGTSESHRRVEDMAAAYIREIKTVQPHGPYFLVGECFGGVVAHEVARQLQDQKERIALLALMDTQRPTRQMYLQHLIHPWVKPVLGNYYVQRIPSHWKTLCQLDHREKIPYLFDKLGNAFVPSSPPPLPRPQESVRSRAKAIVELNTDRRMVKRIDRRRELYRRALRRHKPKPYGGRIQILVNEEFYSRDRTLGWGQLAVKGLEIHKLPGDHDSYIREHVQVAAKKLRECLQRAEAGVN